MADKELYGYEEDEIITLEFDDGEVECGTIGVFDAFGKEYIALNPLGTEDVYIFCYKEDGEDFDMMEIEDEEEFEKVAAEFDRLVMEEI